MRIFRSFFIFVILFLSACANTVRVDINAIVDPNYTAQSQQRYVLQPGPNVTADLFYKEFSQYFNKILQNSGFIPAQKASEADLKIVLSYHISDQKSGIYTYASPIYEFVGGEVITITEKSSDPSAPAKQTTIHIPSRLQRTGTSIHSEAYPFFEATTALTASTMDNRPVWSISLQGKTRSNDLRWLMPYFSLAAKPYIGKNTGHTISVEIRKNDPLLPRLNN